MQPTWGASQDDDHDEYAARDLYLDDVRYKTAQATADGDMEVGARPFGSLQCAFVRTSFINQLSTHHTIHTTLCTHTTTSAPSFTRLCVYKSRICTPGIST